MYLLATDYDGTFYTDIKNLYLNKKAVENLMKNGNKFAIVTGRSFDSIKKEINRYNIKYNYLSCNNGLVIFDNKDNIIKSSILSEDDLNFIYNSVISNPKVSKVELYNLYTSTESMKEILELLVRFKTIKQAKEYKKYLESIKQNIICFRQLNKLFISNNINKADSVSYIQQLENIKPNDIYAVGDSANDIEMLERYNGYKMLYSSPELWLKKYPITSEVHALVKKINRKEYYND